MYVCVHVCVHVCTYVCMHACMHACMYIFVCYISPIWISIDTVHVCILYIYIYIYICLHIYICIYIWWLWWWWWWYTYIYMYICTNLFLVQSHVSLVKSQYFHEEHHHVWWLNPNESWSVPTFLMVKSQFSGEFHGQNPEKINCFTAEVLQCISKGQDLGLNKSGETSS